MGESGACRLVDLPRLRDHRGSLTVLEPGPVLPFEIRRTYYLYDTPPDAERGGHAHRRLEQLFIALAGAVDVELDDGSSAQVYRLDRPDVGLYIGPMIWRVLRHFEPGTVCMVLASERYDESDYFRRYADFRSAVSGA
jgi:hypothetical protein